MPANDATACDAPAEPLAAFLVRALATACQREPAALAADVPLLALELDSLGLVAVLSQVEAVYGLELEPAETAALLSARDVGELVARVTRAHERTRKAACGGGFAPAPRDA